MPEPTRIEQLIAERDALLHDPFYGEKRFTDVKDRMARIREIAVELRSLKATAAEIILDSAEPSGSHPKLSEIMEHCRELVDSSCRIPRDLMSPDIHEFYSTEPTTPELIADYWKAPQEPKTYFATWKAALLTIAGLLVVLAILTYLCLHS